MDAEERTKNVVTPVSQESIKSPAKAHSTYQDPSTIFRSPHPDTGDLYTEVNTQGKTKKMKQVGLDMYNTRYRTFTNQQILPKLQHSLSLH